MQSLLDNTGHGAENSAWNEYAILSTKISLPAQRPVTIQRPRLTETITEGLERKLTLIVAPAGWGKSSLIADWYAEIESQRNVAWLSLDEGDNDPARFLHYLISAIDQQSPGLGDEALGLLFSPNRPANESILTEIINGLATLPRGIILVLDDYHYIDNAHVHAAMTFLLDHLPRTLHIIVASRYDPAWPLPRLRVRGELTELRAADLRFQDNETEAFLRDVMGLNLEHRDVIRLLERTEGWIAGLQLAALSLQGRTDVASFVNSFAGNNRYVVDYLTDEVISEQPEPIQQFLLETSILETLSSSLCDAVMDRPNSKILLEEVEAANLFLIALDDDRTRYRYHNLFSDVLRARLRATRPEIVPELHRRASLWFGERNMADEAISHALSAEDFERAATLITLFGPAAWRSGKLSNAERWIDALPRHIRDRHASLLLLRAQCYILKGAFNSVVEALDACAKLPIQDDPTIFGGVLRMRAHIARLQGDLSLSLTLCQQALAVLPDHESLSRAFTHIAVAFVHLTRGDLEPASSSLHLAAQAKGAAQDLHADMFIRRCRAYSKEMQGELQAASEINKKIATEMAGIAAQNLAEALLTAASESRIRYEWNDLPGALEAVADLAQARHQVYGVPAILSLVIARNGAGDIAGALEGLDEADEALRGTEAHLNTRYAQAVRAFVCRHDHDQARAWLAECDGHANTPGYYNGFADVAWGYVALELQWHQRVIERLVPRLNHLVSQGCHGTAVQIRVVLALAFVMSGEQDKAVTVLEPAVELASREGYIRSFLTAGPAIVPVLKSIAATGTAPLYVARLLDAFPATLLSERELDVLRLISSGRSNNEIASQLFIGEGTVKRHLHNIYGKLDAKGRAGAVTKARGLGLLS